MTDEHATTRSLSLEQWPDPICRYGDDGTPMVERVNDAFERTFGTVQTGQRMASVFDEFGLSIVLGPDDPDAIGTADDQLLIETGTQAFETGPPARYLVRVIPVDGNSEGMLVFTPLPKGARQGLEGIGLDHVASVISHDLRNPLDVAKARLRAARETGEKGHFEHVTRAHDRMERIIEDVLTLARGPDVVQPDEPVDLESAAEAAWETVETDDTGFVVEQQLPTVVADPNRLGRLFENLFRNAVEHGGTDVTVTVGPLTEEVGFYVADDGRGIPSARRERVFNPGFSTDDHGTGLGLSIVARIVDLHGWSITVTDSAADGARFEITGLETV
jgi:signal transduction histidine kinase